MSHTFIIPFSFIALLAMDSVLNKTASSWLWPEFFLVAANVAFPIADSESLWIASSKTCRPDTCLASNITSLAYRGTKVVCVRRFHASLHLRVLVLCAAEIPSDRYLGCTDGYFATLVIGLQLRATISCKVAHYCYWSKFTAR